MGRHIAPAAVEFCRKRMNRAGLPGTFTVGEMTSIRFFDGIVCVAALDHVTLQGAKQTIREIRRVMAPRAMAFITFDPPHRDSEIEGEAQVQEDGSLYFTEGRQKGMLFRRYTDDEIRNLIGLENITSFEHTDNGGRIVVCR